MAKKPPVKKTKKQVAAEAKVKERREQAAIDRKAELLTRESNRRGHYIVHATSRSQLHLTPILSIPMVDVPNSPTSICPTCQVWHPVKTLHIYVDDVGKATVSAGVLKLLKKAGMDGFVEQGSTKKPPPLKIGQGATRQKIDYSNRAQVIYTKGKPKNPPQVILPG